MRPWYWPSALRSSSASAADVGDHDGVGVAVDVGVAARVAHGLALVVLAEDRSVALDEVVDASLLALHAGTAAGAVLPISERHVKLRLNPAARAGLLVLVDAEVS
jgi:hypothetical protein